ncbi:Tuliposide A-converting enzyme b1, amyloplastic [Dichanthelium oligosanthes]|uniref:Tuliposide A-converting enzyme b1, amyloplastic n=1 Tax=Dichanthelium oligosanthes TaxID=888268 RepID=A0A1E5VCQ7_9POAL|nr:Tuliposide A-converting enzyme b1, amyloplastic [Dichanthelium oligosanthes]
MEVDADEVVIDYNSFRIYRSGKMDRLRRPARVPAGLEPATGVTSKDVVLDASTGLSARLFLPSRGAHGSSKKHPILVFFHGGAFLIESAVSPWYHGYVASLAAAAGVLAVSVEYRLAPEHPVPAAYDDAWAALQWAASARDEWLAEHGDVARLFVAGHSAGGNMVHDVLVKLASFSQPAAPRIEGAILLHPWFGGSTLVEGEDATKAKEMAMIWEFACPGAVGGVDNPRMNPMAPGAPALESLRCQRMLVCTGEKDWSAARNRAYYAAVAASAWRGSTAWLELEGEGHVFFLENPECTKARELMDRIVSFVNGS